jgi:antirestriction protein ArdC
MSASEASSRQDIYTRITASIVTQLEDGVRPWARTWNSAHPAGPITRPLRHAGEPYSGINVLSLWASAMAHGFAAPIWMTYRQAGELRGQVRKGEKGSPVVYANALTRTDTDAVSGDQVEKTIPYLKGYTVFNVEQIDGLPSHYYAPQAPRCEPAVRIAHAESFFMATGAAISHGGNCAFYRPATDSIQMPPFEAFRDAESYYATLAHEVTHWTAPAVRCDRQCEGKRFGSEGYAMEELVAELGSAFLCADLDLALEPREDHASYIANWLEVLNGDNRAIFTAASYAQRAADYLTKLQPGLSQGADAPGAEAA